jgi:hypothetical protein
MKEVPENDWKYFRSLQEALTERYCSETLSHIRQIVSANAVDGSLRRLQEILIKYVNEIRYSVTN